MPEPPPSRPDGAAEPDRAAQPAAAAAHEEEGRFLPVPVGAARGAAAEVDAVEARPIDRPPAADLPAPLAVAAGGFLAGFVTFTLARLVRGRAPWLAVRRRRALEHEITSTRSFLVDVHFLKR